MTSKSYTKQELWPGLGVGGASPIEPTAERRLVAVWLPLTQVDTPYLCSQLDGNTTVGALLVVFNIARKPAYVASPRRKNLAPQSVPADPIANLAVVVVPLLQGILLC